MPRITVVCTLLYLGDFVAPAVEELCSSNPKLPTRLCVSCLRACLWVGLARAVITWLSLEIHYLYSLLHGGQGRVTKATMFSIALVQSTNERVFRGSSPLYLPLRISTTVFNRSGGGEYTLQVVACANLCVHLELCRTVYIETLTSFGTGPCALRPNGSSIYRAHDVYIRAATSVAPQ